MIPNNSKKYIRGKGLVERQSPEMDTQGGSQLDFLAFHLSNGKWRQRQ
jgi:hypothetical protein